MDKYTVDLDKVLNDFEYSELTEQSADSHPPYPSPSAESRSHIGPAKHSINNVFTSLDEYLNTEINGAPKQREVYLHSAKDSRDGFKAIDKSEVVHMNVNSVNSFDVNGGPSLLVGSEVKSDVFDTEIDGKSRSEIGAGENVCSLGNGKIEGDERVESCKVETVERVVEDNGNVELQAEVKNVEERNNDVEKEKEGVEVVGEDRNDLGGGFEGKEVRNEMIEVAEEPKREVVEERKIEVETVEHKIEVQTVLDEQKIEEEIQIANNVVGEEEKIEVEVVLEQHSEVKAINKESESEVGMESAIEVGAVEEMVEEAPKFEKPAEEVKQLDEIKQESLVVNTKGETEGASAVGFGVSMEFDEEDLQQYLDKLEDTATNGNGNPTEETEPSSLKLNNEVSDTSVDRPASLGIPEKREINLIGNPGSTPYNNLYVSKEIPVTKPPYESESSASVSPTFSEASTDSVRSTDSTDVENETLKADDDEVPPKLPPRSPIRIEPIPDGEPDPHAEEDIYVNLDNLNEESNRERGGAEGEQSVDVWLGKRAPIWIPDAEALNCLHCDMKFTVIKRRHHCRACGLVLCSKCCNMRHKLEYLDMEARVCTRCHEILSRDNNSSSGSEVSNSPWRQAGQPNPNNPMEYCSVVPPLQQVSSAGDNPPSVMVPVGVLKRTGSNKAKHNKSVMFCDGIRPGSDLTNLDNDFNYSDKVAPATAATSTSSSSSSTGSSSSSSSKLTRKIPLLPKANRNIPAVDPNTKSFIQENESCLPPTVTTFKSDISYTECANNANVVEMLKNETLTFALQRNLHVHVRLISMDCCINKQAWCFSTEGLITAGQDEIVILLEYVDNEKLVPKDIFYHLNNIYNDAVKGTTVTELGLSIHPTTNFLDSKNHAGFIYIRPTLQCLQNVIVPKESYLVGVLVHRWETPWAKNFPLRLVLRLGAEYRYYPSPLISTRHRDSVFVEIGQTIINLLADFRNFTYTLPNIRGLSIHMEEKSTTVTIPVNRYDQVMKSISNSSEHILAFGGNFSSEADSHLVCIQDVNGSNENKYTTHAINIQNKPRKVTGASFIVFNGALKSSSGLTAKSSIVEDGLMVQIPPEHMIQVRECLKNMKNHTIQCGCVNAASDETVSIVWGERDTNFNVGVKSSVDDTPLSGIPSIRVHNGKDFPCNSGERLIRWTEVFLLKSGEENARAPDGIDISKIAESISKATCQALVKYLNLLATNNFYKIGIRTTLHADNVSYSAGSNGIKLPPIYMKSLDNELIPVLHRITSNNLGDSAIILELVFRILNV